MDIVNPVAPSVLPEGVGVIMLCVLHIPVIHRLIQMFVTDI